MNKTFNYILFFIIMILINIIKKLDLISFIKFYLNFYFKIFYTSTFIKNKNFDKFELNCITYDKQKELKFNNSIISTVINNIPNNIFQIWLNKYDNNSSIIKLPQEIFNNIIKLKNNNPFWKYHLISIDDVSDIFENNQSNDLIKKVYQIYKHINNEYLAVKSDILRYVLMYLYGGVYLDIKSYSVNSLDKLIKSDKIQLYNWCEPNIDFKIKQKIFPRMTKMKQPEIAQWCLIYPQKHIIIEKVLYNLIKNYNLYLNKNNVNLFNVFEFSGPTLYTNTISEVIENNQEIKNEISISECIECDKLCFNNLKYDHRIYYDKDKHYSKLNSMIIN